MYLYSSTFAFQWTDCQAVGRDLVRLLQNVARIPEFEKLWREMMLNPSAICPTFTGMLCFTLSYLDLVHLLVLIFHRFSVRNFVWFVKLIFAGVQQLMHTRTSRKYLISRLTPDMENKLVFLITKVLLFL